MSGGHYGYAYSEVDEFANAMLVQNNYDYTDDEYKVLPASDYEIRLKVSAHLQKVATLMRAIEWCDSGDTGEDDCHKAMVEFLELLKE